MTDSSPSTPHPLSAHRVLVVDDHPATATGYATLLRAAGYEVHTALDGVTGLRAATEQVFDAMLWDFGLPWANGLDVLRRLRSQPVSQDIPVAIITGAWPLAPKILDELAYLRAVVAYKPLGFDELHTLVQTLVQSRTRA
jgi:DNA-binding response OmpR family regulator